MTNELIAEFKRVTGKENLLFRIAEAALSAPESRVRDVVFPAVSGGEQTLREVVAELRSKSPTYRRTVKTSMRASCTSHYRKGLTPKRDTSANAARPTPQHQSRSKKWRLMTRSLPAPLNPWEPETGSPLADASTATGGSETE